MTPVEAPTRVRRKLSGTWPTDIAMSVGGATVGGMTNTVAGAEGVTSSRVRYPFG